MNQNSPSTRSTSCGRRDAQRGMSPRMKLAALRGCESVGRAHRAHPLHPLGCRPAVGVSLWRRGAGKNRVTGRNGRSAVSALGGSA
jgi:hypothetical protein